MPTLESRLQAAMTDVIQKHSTVEFSLSATQTLQEMALKSAPNVASAIPKDIPSEDRAVELAKGRFSELIASAPAHAAIISSMMVNDECVAAASQLHGKDWPFAPI